MIEYQGYSGLMEVDVEDGVISGRVLGIRDVVTFEGGTVVEAIQAFHDSVDDYLAFCENARRAREAILGQVPDANPSHSTAPWPSRQSRRE